MDSPSPQPNLARRGRPARSQAWLFVSVALALSIGVIFFSTIYYGGIEGQEFSPDNFTRRSFRYLEIPLLGFQVSPIERRDVTTDLERYLIGQQIVSETKTTDAQWRWDLVTAVRGVADMQVPFAQGEANILCQYLDSHDQGKNQIWLDWSKKHPKLAQYVWPAIAKLARQELYLFVPDVLAAARGAVDPADFQRQLDALLAEKYCAFATNQQQLGRHELAVELFSEAVSRSPEMAEAYTGRAASLAQLGDQTRADADIAQAQGLKRSE